MHAALQVVHFDSTSERPDSAWVRGVNAHLPASVSVVFAQPVGDDFHARFAATARHYTYLLLNRPQRPGLMAGRVGWYDRPGTSMRPRCTPLRTLLGTHDFTSFRAAECQAKSPVKTMHVARVAAQGELLRFDFCASAFLQHMVRNIVGALVTLGAGRQPPGYLADLLALRDRTRGAPTFAADGLYFAGADYDARFGLPPTVREVMLA